MARPHPDPVTTLSPPTNSADSKPGDCDAQGAKSMGAHTKFWMVDDAAFYLGSQNLYPNNLAEWGMIIDDAGI